MNNPSIIFMLSLLVPTFSLSGQAEISRPSPAEVVQKMFDSLASGDLNAYNNSVASDFFLFDLGERLSKDDFFSTVKKARAKGVKTKWLLTKPEVHMSGNLAWIAYINQGVFEVDGKTSKKKWLESAVLERDKTWKVRFLHSTAAKTEGR